MFGPTALFLHFLGMCILLRNPPRSSLTVLEEIALAANDQPQLVIFVCQHLQLHTRSGLLHDLTRRPSAGVLDFIFAFPYILIDRRQCVVLYTSLSTLIMQKTPLVRGNLCGVQSMRQGMFCAIWSSLLNQCGSLWSVIGILQFSWCSHRDIFAANF